MTLDGMVNYLNEQSVGASFARDLWVNQPETDYGTVRLASDNVFWADNRPVKRASTFEVTLYTRDEGDSVTQALETALTGTAGLRKWSLTGCELLTDPVLMRRRWSVTCTEAMS